MKAINRGWYSITNKKGDSEGTTASVSIFDEIGFFGVRANQFIDDLKAQGEVDRIELSINSPGGEVFDGIAIYNALQQHPAHVTADVLGLAASMAGVIAMAADEVRIPENAFLMLHNPSGGVMGEAADMRDMAGVLDQIRDALVGAFTKKSPQLSRDDVLGMMNATTYLSGEQAHALGLADVVTDAVKLAACADLSKLPGNVPSVLLTASQESQTLTSNTVDMAADTITKPAPVIEDEPKKTLVENILEKLRPKEDLKADAESQEIEDSAAEILSLTTELAEMKNSAATLGEDLNAEKQLTAKLTADIDTAAATIISLTTENEKLTGKINEIETALEQQPEKVATAAAELLAAQGHAPVEGADNPAPETVDIDTKRAQLWDEYEGITDPSEKQNFYNKHRKTLRSF